MTLNKQASSQPDFPKENKDVRDRVIDALKTNEKRELTAEQADNILNIIKTRFEKSGNIKLHKSIDFLIVEKSLRAAPEKLYALFKLEETGGEPELIDIDGGDYIFEDRCTESPSGRRNLNYLESELQAEEFGAEMQSPESYEVMQDYFGNFDTKSSSWLKSARSTGYSDAWIGCKDELELKIERFFTLERGRDLGWRASLRVKIVK